MDICIEKKRSFLLKYHPLLCHTSLRNIRHKHTDNKTVVPNVRLIRAPVIKVDPGCVRPMTEADHSAMPSCSFIKFYMAMARACSRSIVQARQERSAFVIWGLAHVRINPAKTRCFGCARQWQR